jgi:hypothetical protein
MDNKTKEIISKLRDEVVNEELSTSQRIKIEILDELRKRLDAASGTCGDPDCTCYHA